LEQESQLLVGAGVAAVFAEPLVAVLGFASAMIGTIAIVGLLETRDITITETTN
tara:strand:- start:311 stop:472 length:162 start_codon:yes stop_codon:yes gene_type:complete